MELRDFRNIREARLEPAFDGLTVITGDNGAGKTSLLEAIAFGSLMRSFRGSPREALVRNEANSAIVRLEAEDAGRTHLIELEIALGRRDQARLDRRAVSRASELVEALRVSVFSPDDLSLTKGGPQERRSYLDDVLVAKRPRNLELCHDVDRVLRQRATLLRQAGGRLSAEIATTLDVWDDQLARAGEALVTARQGLVARLTPIATAAYSKLTGRPESLTLEYQCSYSGRLADALVEARTTDIRRGITTVGPHRDELLISAGGLDARSRLSQGRQRGVTLALRIAAHTLVTEIVGSPPVLLLDDAFSELDAATSDALLRALPSGQALLTTASGVPASAEIALAVSVADGIVRV